MVYFGLCFPKNGLQPTDEKVRAIKDAPIPQNLFELRSFLRMLTALTNFIPRLPTLDHPLCKLQSNKEMGAELRLGLLGC